MRGKKKLFLLKQASILVIELAAKCAGARHAGTIRKETFALAPKRMLLCIESQIGSAASQSSILFNDPIDSQKVNRCISVFSAGNPNCCSKRYPMAMEVTTWNHPGHLHHFPTRTWNFPLQRDVTVHYNSHDLCSFSAALLSSLLLSHLTRTSGQTQGQQTVF